MRHYSKMKNQKFYKYNLIEKIRKMAVEELTENNFEDFIKEGNALVDFYADWCMPCLTMSPIVEEISEKMNDHVRFGKVDVGENKDIAEKFGVSSVPNFVLFKDGEKVDQFSGSMTAEELEEKIKANL